jgi:hypothetical protein
MTNKPTSKVIQISKTTHIHMTVLCEDGSIWERSMIENEVIWTCSLEPYCPQEASEISFVDIGGITTKGISNPKT